MYFASRASPKTSSSNSRQLSQNGPLSAVDHSHTAKCGTSDFGYHPRTKPSNAMCLTARCPTESFELARDLVGQVFRRSLGTLDC